MSELLNFKPRYLTNMNIADNPFLLIQALGIDFYSNIVSHIKDFKTFKLFCLTIAANEGAITAEMIINLFFQSDILKSKLNNVEKKCLYDNKYLLFASYFDLIKKEEKQDNVLIVQSHQRRLCYKCKSRSLFYIMWNDNNVYIFKKHINSLVSLDLNKATQKSTFFHLLNVCQYGQDAEAVEFLLMTKNHYLLIIAKKHKIYFCNLYCDGDEVIEIRNDIYNFPPRSIKNIDVLLNLTEISYISTMFSKRILYLHYENDDINETIEYAVPNLEEYTTQNINNRIYCFVYFPTVKNTANSSQMTIFSHFKSKNYLAIEIDVFQQCYNLAPLINFAWGLKKNPNICVLGIFNNCLYYLLFQTDCNYVARMVKLNLNNKCKKSDINELFKNTLRSFNDFL